MSALPDVPAAGRPRDDGFGTISSIVAAAAFVVVFAAVLVPLLFGSNANACEGSSSAGQPAPSKAANAIPRNYLTLYQKAGQQYGIPWNVLAGIGKVESDHGRLKAPGVTSGSNPWGAAGPMQFGIGGAAGNTWGGTPRHPASQHVGMGVDGNGDGWDDVYDPNDAIPAAARYLKTLGAPGDMHKAIWGYNHSEPYIQHVLALAKQYADGGFTVGDDNTAGVTCSPGSMAAPNGIAAKVIAFAKWSAL